MLIQNNADLDSERKALMDNVSQLLSQYQELLAISLEDKKHFHEEEKNYTERVHSLKRQKEKLEEKIMEHYKKSETTVQKKYVKDYSLSSWNLTQNISQKTICQQPRSTR